MKFDETLLQYQLHEIRKKTRRDSNPYPSLTISNNSCYFNASARRKINSKYINWFVGIPVERKKGNVGKTVFVKPTDVKTDNSYVVSKSTTYVPSQIRDVLGNGVFSLTNYGDVFEITKIYKKIF